MKAQHVTAVLCLALVGLGASAGCERLVPAANVSAGSGTKTGGGAVTRRTHEGFFPIEAGAHGSADCNSCHGGLDTFKEFSCVGCHEHEQTATNATHAGVTGYEYDSKACLTCHATGQAGAVSRADHTKFFPIDMGTPHAAGQCTDCHSDPANKAMFTCVSCHEHAQPVTDRNHAAVAAYKYDSKACLSCHPAGVGGTIARADHTKFFPIDMGTPHAKGQCTDCHTDAADKRVFTCISCHDHARPVTDMHHAKVADYKYDSASCLRCHAQGKATFDHAALGALPNCIGCHRGEIALAVTTPASNHAVNAFPPACEGCHKSFTAWGPGTPMHHELVGHTTAKCETCHLANFKAAVSPFNHVGQGVAASTCNTCHVDFATWTSFVHNPASCYDGATRRSHEKATCVQCHTTPGDYKKSSCTACHRDRGTDCND
jgi:hypothetical protein